MRWAKVPFLGLGPVEGGASAPHEFRVPLLKGPCTPPSRPPLPQLQYGNTPLHAAAMNGSAPVVALLLATPGVDPLAKTRVRGTQRWLRGPPACPMPLPSGAVWLDSALLGVERRKLPRSRAAAGGPARRSNARSSGSTLGVSWRRRRCGRGAGGHPRSGAAFAGALLPSLNTSSRLNMSHADSSDPVHAQPRH